MEAKQKSPRHADNMVRQHLPEKLFTKGHGPMALAHECMELSTKIQHLSEDYMFVTVFMEYVKLKDPALYKQGKLTAESVINNSNKEETTAQNRGIITQRFRLICTRLVLYMLLAVTDVLAPFETSIVS